ncbi:peptidyl-prolyl cis-trans isomerase [Gluconobacter sp. Dm-73]|uniref:peptidyl-prolyl cis-trans isomerase n=1 Tax=Gluconobacter sp. Dm-73 TaxID=2799802 RepID=UPI001B8B98BD|nr:peptidyl-prolyl cis-trans isomerase [Gluconobacter sp. Dm-73]MBS1075066.1 peptidyl-prolyl cis-trans isomerase [Gluconobacter sp. Dm-73]
MIISLRHLFVDSWIGRAAALLIFLAFIGWGVGDVYSNLGATGSNEIVRIYDRSITPDDFSRALSAQLPAVAKQIGLADPSKLPKSEVEQIARQTLQNLVMQNEIQLAAERAGMMVPDDLVRQDIFAIPAFHDAAGKFDRSIFNDRLTRMGLTEGKLIQVVREDIASRGLLQGIGQAVVAPPSLTGRMLSFDANQRVFDMVEIPFASGTVTAPPTDEQLHRFYDNHPQMFRTTEYRHAKMVVMTADSVAKTIEVPDDVLHRLYDFQARTYDMPETRTLQVLTFTDQAKAAAAATAWKGGLSWDDIQKKFPEAAAVALPSVRQSDIPNPELAKAAFAAQPDRISGPEKTGMGWVVFNITAVVAPHKTTFEQAKGDLKKQVQTQESAEALQARQKQFQDAVAGSSTLEQIPGDLGAVPAAGTLDSNGMTQDGLPAPIPGDEALRQAIVHQVFTQSKGAQPTVVNGPNGTFFSVLVDEVHPGTLKPFDSVRDQVVQAWTAEQKRRAANLRATALFGTAKSGTLRKAMDGQPEASALRQDMSVSRVHPDQSLPQNILRGIFDLKPGTTGMFETPDAFWLVNVTADRPASAEDLKSLGTRLVDDYRQSMQSDIPMVLSAAMEKAFPPSHINMALYNQVVAAAAPASAPAAENGAH